MLSFRKFNNIVVKFHFVFICGGKLAYCQSSTALPSIAANPRQTAGGSVSFPKLYDLPFFLCLLFYLLFERNPGNYFTLFRSMLRVLLLCPRLYLINEKAFQKDCWPYKNAPVSNVKNWRRAA